MRVLHLVNWYPNVLAAGEAPFVARHVSALRPFVTEQEVWHIECRKGPRWRWVSRSLLADRTALLVSPVRRWRLLEIMGTLMVAFAWVAWRGRGRFDLVNLHIAYPLGVRMRLLLALFKVPLAITEHWSAYHYSFNSSSKGIDRIRGIFRHGVPVLCVSRSLAQDIRTFSGVPGLRTHVVDNVVDTSIHRPVEGEQPVVGVFLAVGLRWPKRPELLLEALAKLRHGGRSATLRLVGDGPGTEELAKRAEALGIAGHVRFLGHLSPEELSMEMRAAHALLHASDHETYSVVCAESICCGTPVIASAVGGIPEVVGPEAGWLVSQNTTEDWAAAWEGAWDAALAVDRSALSAGLSERVAPDTVGRRYHAVLRSIMERDET